MKFTIASTDLVAALAWVTKAIPVRPAQPVLAGVKIDVTGTTATLSGFDFEQSSLASVEVEDAEDGTVIVSGKLLADIARALPQGDVKFVVKDTKLLVTAKTSKFSLAILPTEDYPALPEHPKPLGTVDANAFADAVRTVVPASGRDDMLPVLTAINVSIDPATGTITLAATDRFRLAVRSVAFEGAPSAQPVTLLVPAKVLNDWAKALTGAEGTRFTLGSDGLNSNTFAVETEGRSATVRVIDGSYPKFQALIPTDFAAESVINTLDLAAAVKRVALVADRSTPAAITFNADGISVSATADSEAVEEVDAEHAGAEVRIGFNVAYLLDGLNALGSRPARISLVSGNKPAVIRPVDDENYTYLIMPMRG
jgi:DNA polymerase III subunit beta